MSTASQGIAGHLAAVDALLERMKTAADKWQEMAPSVRKTVANVDAVLKEDA